MTMAMRSAAFLAAIIIVAASDGFISKELETKLQRLRAIRDRLQPGVKTLDRNPQANLAYDKGLVR